MTTPIAELNWQSVPKQSDTGMGRIGGVVEEEHNTDEMTEAISIWEHN